MSWELYLGGPRPLLSSWIQGRTVRIVFSSQGHCPLIVLAGARYRLLETGVEAEELPIQPPETT